MYKRNWRAKKMAMLLSAYINRQKWALAMRLIWSWANFLKIFCSSRISLRCIASINWARSISEMLLDVLIVMVKVTLLLTTIINSLRTFILKISRLQLRKSTTFSIGTTRRLEQLHQLDPATQEFQLEARRKEEWAVLLKLCSWKSWCH